MEDSVNHQGVNLAIKEADPGEESQSIDEIFREIDAIAPGSPLGVDIAHMDGVNTAGAEEGAQMLENIGRSMSDKSFKFPVGFEAGFGEEEIPEPEPEPEPLRQKGGRVQRWLRKASLIIPEPGPMLQDDPLDPLGNTMGKIGGDGGFTSRSVSNRSVALSNRTYSNKSMLSQRSVSRSSILSARSFLSKSSVAASIKSALAGRPVHATAHTGLSSSQKKGDTSALMSEAAIEIDQSTLVTRQSEYGRFLTSRFLRATRFPAGMLDTIMKRSRTLLSRSHPSLPSTALVAILSKPWFRLFLIGVCAVHCGTLVTSISSWAHHAVPKQSGEFIAYRFLPVGRDTPAMDPAWVGLLVNGCDLEVDKTWEVIAGGGVQIVLKVAVNVNGWSIRWPRGGDEGCMGCRNFALEGRPAGGMWEVVGTTRWTHSTAAMLPYAPPLPTWRTHYDLRAGWEWGAQHIIIPIIVLACIVAAAVSVLQKREEWGMRWLVGALIMPVPIHVVCITALLLNNTQDVPLVGHSIASLAVKCMIFFAALKHNRIFLPVLAAGGVVILVADLFMQGRMGFGRGSGGSIAILSWLRVEAFVLLFPVVANTLWMLYETWRVGRTVAKDVEGFEEIWKEVCSSQLADIMALARLCESKDKGPARQVNRLRIEAGRGPLGGKRAQQHASSDVYPVPDGRIQPPGSNGMADLAGSSFSSIVLNRQTGGSLAGVLDGSCPVESLDQLFAQAAGVDNFLRSKVKAWAKESGGLVAMEGGGLEMYSDVASRGAEKQVVWAACKKPDRAMAKAFFSYQGQVSNLVDLCRQRIAFEDVLSLGLALMRLMEDPEIRVERVKNTMHPAWNAALGGGLRQVIVNLRVDDAVTRWLGIETHVCEVSLCLKPYAEALQALTLEQHKRYIVFRNFRLHRISVVPTWLQLGRFRRKKKQILPLTGDAGTDSPLSRSMRLRREGSCVESGIVTVNQQVSSAAAAPSVLPMTISKPSARDSGTRDCDESWMSRHFGRWGSTGDITPNDTSMHSMYAGTGRLFDALQKEHEKLEAIRASSDDPRKQKRWSFVGGADRISMNYPVARVKMAELRSPAQNRRVEGDTAGGNRGKSLTNSLVGAKDGLFQGHTAEYKGSERTVRESYLWQEFFIAAYLNTTMDVGAFLEKRLQREVAAMAMASSASAMYVSRPLAAASTTAWFKAVMLLVSVAFFINIYFDLEIFYRNKQFDYACVRFTALSADFARGTTPWVHHNATTPVIEEVSAVTRLVGGLILPGCQYKQGVKMLQGSSLLGTSKHKYVATNGSTMTLCRDELTSDDVKFIGWYVHNELAPGQGARYRLEVASWEDMMKRGDAAWRLVGASGAKFSSQGLWSLGDGASTGPWALSVPWQWMVAILTFDVCFTVLPALCLVLASKGLHRYVHLSLSAAFLLSGNSSLAGAIGYTLQDSGAESFALYCHAIIYYVCSLMLFFEHRLVVMILGLSVTFTATAIVESAVMIKDWRPFMLRPPTGALLLFVLWVVIVYRRMAALKYSRELVAADTMVYEEAWNNVVNKPNAELHLAAIADIAKQVVEKRAWSRGREGNDLQQCNRKDGSGLDDIEEGGERRGSLCDSAKQFNGSMATKIDKNGTGGPSPVEKANVKVGGYLGRLPTQLSSTIRAMLSRGRSSYLVKSQPLLLLAQAKEQLGGPSSGEEAATADKHAVVPFDDAAVEPPRGDVDAVPTPMENYGADESSERAGLKQIQTLADEVDAILADSPVAPATVHGQDFGYAEVSSPELPSITVVVVGRYFGEPNASTLPGVCSSPMGSAVAVPAAENPRALPAGCQGNDCKKGILRSASWSSKADGDSSAHGRPTSTTPRCQGAPRPLGSKNSSSSSIERLGTATSRGGREGIHSHSKVHSVDGIMGLLFGPASVQALGVRSQTSSQTASQSLSQAFVRSNSQASLSGRRADEDDNPQTITACPRTTSLGARSMISNTSDVYEGRANPLAAARSGGEDLCRQDGKSALQHVIDKASSINDLKTMMEMTGADEAVGNVLTGMAGTVDWNSPIRSLDQLFAQAAGIDIILKAYVQRWALMSSGSFPLARGGHSRFIRWEAAVQNPMLARSIKWGKLKSPERAIEKAFRSYKGDVSKLLDLSRQAIVFEDLASLHFCLDTIYKDPDVVLERVKNRLDPNWDARTLSAGYRDVSLNLRIVNNATKGMGIETHICEVQLLLMAFAELKNDAGHKRYVAWRNTRGE